MQWTWNEQIIERSCSTQCRLSLQNSLETMSQKKWFKSLQGTDQSNVYGNMKSHASMQQKMGVSNVLTRSRCDEECSTSGTTHSSHDALPYNPFMPSISSRSSLPTPANFTIQVLIVINCWMAYNLKTHCNKFVHCHCLVQHLVWL